jgi:hypothetical protein
LLRCLPATATGVGLLGLRARTRASVMAFKAATARRYTPTFRLARKD